MSDIKISVESTESPQVDGEITIVRVDGVIDTITAHELEKVANSLLAQKRFKIVVDLGGVDYISSAGWGIFISNIREIRLNNGDIKLCRMIPNVYEIFELLEFDSILRAFDNVEKAKADFAGNAAAKKSAPIKAEVAGGSGAGNVGRPTISMENVTGAKAAGQPATTKISLNEPHQPVSATAVRKEPPKAPRRFEDAILELVGKDPFLSVGEIRKEIAREFRKTGYFKVWWTLRKLGLGSKRKRFYFARTRNFSA